MRVLVGCEYSGVVRDAFIRRGHNAISCDVLETESDGPHYKGDIFDMLNAKWGLIILHPPCTAMCLSGNRHYGNGKPKHELRMAAIQWTIKLFDKAKECSERVCLENPVSVIFKNIGERIFYMSPSAYRGKDRSRFYTGIADAMASQWGGHHG